MQIQYIHRRLKLGGMNRQTIIQELLKIMKRSLMMELVHFYGAMAQNMSEDLPLTKSRAKVFILGKKVISFRFQVLLVSFLILDYLWLGM